MGDRLRAAVLGATGMVGQRLVKLLSRHELFELTVVAASPSSAGRRYWWPPHRPQRGGGIVRLPTGTLRATCPRRPLSLGSWRRPLRPLGGRGAWTWPSRRYRLRWR
ncbi:hypothetical protein B6U99_05105 [Candidatus Geothermarchaeota archaeon ex4572_27]|nr:MAG: hypothetical protein B6U99_05105 [Candidatus Geothermarchaeota archaeon ex4572_27]